MGYQKKQLVAQTSTKITTNRKLQNTKYSTAKHRQFWWKDEGGTKSLRKNKYGKQRRC